MILGAYKIIKLLFPFLKELFALAKEKEKKKTKSSDPPVVVEEEKITLRTIVVLIGLGSIMLNVYLIERVVTIGVDMVEANKKIAELTAPKPPPIATPPPHPIPKTPDPPHDSKVSERYYPKQGRSGRKDLSHQQLQDIDNIK